MGAWSFADAPSATGSDSCPEDIDGPEQTGGEKIETRSATTTPIGNAEKVALTSSTSYKVSRTLALVAICIKCEPELLENMQAILQVKMHMSLTQILIEQVVGDKKKTRFVAHLPGFLWKPALPGVTRSHADYKKEYAPKHEGETILTNYTQVGAIANLVNAQF